MSDNGHIGLLFYVFVLPVLLFFSVPVDNCRGQWYNLGDNKAKKVYYG